MARDILTVAETADYLRVNRETVYRLVQSGRLPASKIGRLWRIQMPDLIRFLESTKNQRAEHAGLSGSQTER